MKIKIFAAAAHAIVALIVSRDADASSAILGTVEINRATQTANFLMVFNGIPDLTTVDSVGRQETQFQYRYIWD